MSSLFNRNTSNNGSDKHEDEGDRHQQHHHRSDGGSSGIIRSLMLSSSLTSTTASASASTTTSTLASSLQKSFSIKRTTAAAAEGINSSIKRKQPAYDETNKRFHHDNEFDKTTTMMMTTTQQQQQPSPHTSDELEFLHQNETRLRRLSMPLDNDTCPRTKYAEKCFLLDAGLLRENEQTGELEPTGRVNASSRLIIHSRAFNLEFPWPSNIPLSSDSLESYFRDIGHTLTIDYTKSYVRPFALDIDCLCRAEAHEGGNNAITRYAEDPLTRLDKQRNSSSSSIDRTSFPFALPRDPVLASHETSSPYFGMNAATRRRQHTNESDISVLCTIVQRQLGAICPEWRKSLKICFWRRECGYHMYTNITISLPLHIYLFNIIRGVACAQQHQLFLKLELPSRMPLPCSAKRPNEPYRPLIPQQDTINVSGDLEYLEAFESSEQESANSMCCLNYATRRREQYFNHMETLERRVALPTFHGIDNIHVFSKWNFMDQFRIYVEHRRQLRINDAAAAAAACSMRNNDTNNTTETTSSSNDIATSADALIVTSREQLDRMSVDNLVSLLERKRQTTHDKRQRRIIRTQIRLLRTNEVAKFLTELNLTHEGREKDERVYGDFYKLVCEYHGGMYAQHYISALFKAVRPILVSISDNTSHQSITAASCGSSIGGGSGRGGTSSSSSSSSHKTHGNGVISRFRHLLEALLIPDETFNLSRANETVVRLVRYCDEQTFDSYDDSWEEIIRYLSYVYIHEVSPFTNIYTIIDELMCVEFNVASAEEYAANIRLQTKRAEIQKAVETCIKTYTEIVSRLRVLMHCETSGCWYVMNSASVYRRYMKLTDNLPVIERWLIEKRLIEMAASRFNASRAEYQTSSMWCKSKFMFATSVGVFNSVSGLYTAPSPLLRFNKYRNYALWDMTRSCVSYPRQNLDIMQLYRETKRFVTIAHDDLTDLFIYYRLVPTLINLRNTYDIADFRIPIFFNILSVHRNLNEAWFVTEYFPIDPRFVYFIVYLMQEYDYSEIVSYGMLVNRMFNFMERDPTAEQWRNRIAPIIADVRWVAMNDLPEEFDDECNNIVGAGNGCDNGSSSKIPRSRYTGLPLYGRYMRSLMTLCGPHNFDFTENVCFLAVLFAVCMIKCSRVFKSLLSAFEVDGLPELNIEEMFFVARRLDRNSDLYSSFFERVVLPCNEKNSNACTNNNSMCSDDEDDDNEGYYSDSDGCYNSDKEEEVSQHQQQPSSQFGNKAADRGNEEDDDEIKLERVWAALGCKSQKYERYTRIHDTNERRAMVRRVRECLDVRTDQATFKRLLNNAIEKIVGTSLNAHERRLAETVMMLGMSVDFVPENMRELLVMISTVFVSYNQNKKLLVFYGHKDTGKSLLCEALADMGAPDSTHHTNLQNAIERANITTQMNVTIINEINRIETSHMKSITGNDAESTHTFYSQKYETQKSQSLMFGATNDKITFYRKDMISMDVDRTSVERIHGLELIGAQIKTNDDLFEMFTKHQYYRGTLEITQQNNLKHVMANALLWLAYASYVRYRDADLCPRLNEANADVRAYQDDIYIYNNKLYAFLRLCSITESRNMVMKKSTFISIIKTAITENVSRYFKHYNQFVTQFNQQFYNLDQCKEIVNFQQIGLISHIKYTMQTVEVLGNDITRNELDTRIRIYSDEYDRTSAIAYFKEHNSARYDRITDAYRNIQFVTDSLDSYDGNRNSSVNNDICGGLDDDLDNFNGSLYSEVHSGGVSSFHSSLATIPSTRLLQQQNKRDGDGGSGGGMTMPSYHPSLSAGTFLPSLKDTTTAATTFRDSLDYNDTAVATDVDECTNDSASQPRKSNFTSIFPSNDVRSMI